MAIVPEDVLQQLYLQHGYLTPELVVENAKPRLAPLHDHFEWNDSIAGPKYRIEQARLIIKAVRLSPTSENTQPLRKYQAVRLENRADFTYLTPHDIAKDDELAGQVKMQMERDWQRLFTRWCAFRDFITMVRKDLDNVAS